MNRWKLAVLCYPYPQWLDNNRSGVFCGSFKKFIIDSFRLQLFHCSNVRWTTSGNSNYYYDVVNSRIWTIRSYFFEFDMRLNCISADVYALWHRPMKSPAAVGWETRRRKKPRVASYELSNRRGLSAIAMCSHQKCRSERNGHSDAKKLLE